MAPKYERPAAPVPNAWPQGPAYKELAGSASAKAVADIPWQEFFVDPQLRKLIALALENNRDLRVAAELASGLVTLSLGVAQLVPDESVDSLVGRADAAMYAAKEAGRNCTRVAA